VRCKRGGVGWGVCLVDEYKYFEKQREREVSLVTYSYLSQNSCASVYHPYSLPISSFPSLRSQIPRLRSLHSRLYNIKVLYLLKLLVSLENSPILIVFVISILLTSIYAREKDLKL